MELMDFKWQLLLMMFANIAFFVYIYDGMNSCKFCKLVQYLLLSVCFVLSIKIIYVLIEL